jgi:hypothetical protein
MLPRPLMADMTRQYQFVESSSETTRTAAGAPNPLGLMTWPDANVFVQVGHLPASRMQGLPKRAAGPATGAPLGHHLPAALHFAA